jgi:hypothetical protein
VLSQPVMCHWCARYGHSCTGDAGKICGRCIHDWQGCITPEGKLIRVALAGLAVTDLTANENETMRKGMGFGMYGRVTNKGETNYMGGGEVAKLM